MDEDQAPAPPQAWMKALQEAREDVAAGRTLSADQVHAKFMSRLQDASGTRRVVHGSDD